MNAAELCEQYRNALNAKDLLKIQELFTVDAVIRAPISGTAGVTQFHSYLFAHTKKTVAEFPNILAVREKPPAITLQFSYMFLLPNSDLAVLDGTVAFEMDESLGKFKSLTVVYHAAELRALMDKADIAPPPTAAHSSPATQ